MLVSIGELAGAAAFARRRVLRRGDALRRADALRRGDARRALRVAVRLAERFPAFFLDVFLLAVLRDFAVFFAIFRRFLAMRAPPGKWARVF